MVYLGWIELAFIQRTRKPAGMIPELTCYVEQGWDIKIRPAPPTRDWMDATPSSYAYRCLPLNIANASGWEILNPVAFEAVWSGAPHQQALTITCPEGPLKPVSLFGAGVLTFHVFGVFRTSPGWNLWVSSSPNQFKDGISALTGLIETDWSPYTFTMNWKFTRPGRFALRSMNRSASSSRSSATS